VVTRSPFPVIVVTSGSMEPVYYRGDMLFVWNMNGEFDVGDVVVAWFRPRELPMVHRVVRKLARPSMNSEGSGRYVPDLN